MKNGTSKLKLGLFVLVGIGILIFFIFYIGKNKNIFSPTINISSRFEDVNGLTVGNNVRIAGIKVGTVTDIVLESDSSVIVKVVVEKSSQKFIKKDSKMSIGSEGLMGDKVITLVKGTAHAPEISEGDTILSIKPLDTGKLIASLTRTAYNAERITDQLALLSVKMNSKKGLVGKLLTDTSLSNHVDHLVRNLENASGGLSENMEAAKHSFLFRRYFRKKAEKQAEEEEDKNKDNNENNEEKEEPKKSKKRKNKEEDKKEE